MILCGSLKSLAGTAEAGEGVRVPSEDDGDIDGGEIVSDGVRGFVGVELFEGETGTRLAGAGGGPMSSTAGGGIEAGGGMSGGSPGGGPGGGDNRSADGGGGAGENGEGAAICCCSS